MLTNKLVSIIIPCFKQAQYLPDALDSVLAQTYSNWECVVVNDASPDDTIEVANSYVQKDARIKLLNKTNNEGLAAARNSGIAATAGYYILPLDADDRIAETYIAKSVAAYNSRPGIKVVYTDVEHFGLHNNIAERPLINMHHLCHQNHFQPTALYSRIDFEKTDGYRKNVYGYEDWDLWLQLIQSPEEALKIPEPLFYFRVKEHSMITELVADAEKEWAVRINIIANNRKQMQRWAPELLYHVDGKTNWYKFKSLLRKFFPRTLVVK